MSSNDFDNALFSEVCLDIGMQWGHLFCWIKACTFAGGDGYLPWLWACNLGPVSYDLADYDH